jgi:hypothetical protein
MDVCRVHEPSTAFLMLQNDQTWICRLSLPLGKMVGLSNLTDAHRVQLSSGMILNMSLTIQVPACVVNEKSCSNDGSACSTCREPV